MSRIQDRDSIYDKIYKKYFSETTCPNGNEQ